MLVYTKKEVKMATEVTNQATVNYTTTGSSEPQSETSNVSTITLLDESALSINKYTQQSSFTPGGTVTYHIDIENTGTQYFTGVRIIDDLGGTPQYLSYVNGSATLYYNNQVLQAEVESTNPLVFTLSPLASGNKMILTYTCRVSNSIPSTVNSITNSVEGIGYTASDKVTDYTSAVITRNTSANLDITKAASSSSVSQGQVFSYTITLTNQGTTTALVTNITDDLPQNFNIVSVQLKVGTANTTTLSSSDYTVSSNNEFTVPSSTGPTITVPPTSSSGSGKTVLTITGYID